LLIASLAQEIYLDGAVVYISSCNWIEASQSCEQFTFDQQLVAGAHQMLVRFIQHGTNDATGEMPGAYADLKWNVLDVECPNWRVELYGTEEFTQPLPIFCEPFQDSVNHTGFEMPGSWCGQHGHVAQRVGGLQDCHFFSAILTTTVPFDRAGIWTFELHGTGAETWLELDNVRLESRTCTAFDGMLCTQFVYSVYLGTGDHKIATAVAFLGDQTPEQRVRWQWNGQDCRNNGLNGLRQWTARIYNDEHMSTESQIVCMPGEQSSFTVRPATCSLNQIGTSDEWMRLTAAQRQHACYCPRRGRATTCDHWSATFRGDISADRGGIYEFHVATARPGMLAIDEAQLSPDGCVVVNGVCQKTRYTALLEPGLHSVLVSMSTQIRPYVVRADEQAGQPESMPSYMNVSWERVGHGCNASQWRIETMSAVADRIVTSECLLVHPDGFLAVGGDSGFQCPSSSSSQWVQQWVGSSQDAATADGGRQLDCWNFRATFSTTAHFEGGLYVFHERFHDGAVIFIDGHRIRATGCRQAFSSSCRDPQFERAMTAGPHTISVEFKSQSGTPVAELSWERLRRGRCDLSGEPWSNDTWIDANNASGGQLWGGAQGIDVLGDDDSFVAQLGFSFPFFGGNKRHVRVNANGYLTFSGEHHGYGDTAPVPDSALPNDLIAVFWTDMNPERQVAGRKGQIFTKQVPPDANNMHAFVVLWKNMAFYDPCYERLSAEEKREEAQCVTGCKCSTEVATFQCVLYSNGAIRMSYLRAPNPPHANDLYSSVSIGIEDASGTQGFKVAYADRAFPGDQKTIVISDSCTAVACGANEWLVEIFDDLSFENSSAVYCKEFDPHQGHLVTCPDFRSGGCWCPPSLAGYRDHVNLVVEVGISVTSFKQVALPEDVTSVVRCNSRPVNEQRAEWGDTFTVTVEGRNIRVSRTDQTNGWYQNLRIMCTVQYGSQRVEPGGCDHFSALLTSTINSTNDQLYRFHESSRDEAVVFIDGERMHSSGCEFVNGHCAEQVFETRLSAGSHEVQYSFLEYSGVAYAYLAWSPVVNECLPGQWRQELYNNPNFTDLAAVSCETFGSRGFLETCENYTAPGCWCPCGLRGGRPCHSETALQRQERIQNRIGHRHGNPCSQFSATLSTHADISIGGRYLFHVSEEHDESRVFIDGQLQHKTGCSQFDSKCQQEAANIGTSQSIFEAELGPGRHLISVEFVEYDAAGAEAGLTWDLIEQFNCSTFTTGPSSPDSHSIGLRAEKAVIFDVKSAADAIVRFKSDNGLYYEIVIGADSNVRTTINARLSYTARPHSVMQVTTSGILHSYEKLPFWASAEDGLVKLGRGNTVGKAVLVEWRDRNQPLQVTTAEFHSVARTANWGICAPVGCYGDQWRLEIYSDNSHNAGDISCIDGVPGSGFLDTCSSSSSYDMDESAVMSIIDLRIDSLGDTAEECDDATGAVFTGSSDLELLRDEDTSSGGHCITTQIVALRFRDVYIHRGANVSSANLTFVVDEIHTSSNEPVTMVIGVEAAGDSMPLTQNARDISGRVDRRPLMSRPTVLWTLESTRAVGQKITTPDLSVLIQSVLSHPGWHSGNAFTLVVYAAPSGGGTGNHWVSSKDVKLSVEYKQAGVRQGFPGCWCPSSVDCTTGFSAVLTSSLTVAEPTRFRFIEDSSPSSAVAILINGEVLHTTGCEVVGHQCERKVFDTVVDPGSVPLELRYTDREGFAQLSLAWEEVSFVSMRECFSDPQAMDYRGRISTTRTGKACVDWSAQVPYAHPDTNTPETAPDAGLTNNYCRNPNQLSTAWCYTADPAVPFEFCDVGRPSPTCGICTANEWYMELYDNSDFTGIVTAECIDYGDGLSTGARFCPQALLDLPGTRQNSCEFISATFTRTVTLYQSGVYRFFEASAHDSTVFVDGVLVHQSECKDSTSAADSVSDIRCSRHNFEVTLAAGDHIFMYEIQSYSGNAYIDFSWQHVGSGDCRFNVINSSWVQGIATEGTLLHQAMDDDASHTIQLPFNFPYYGGTKTHVKVSSNGYLTFSGDHNAYGDTDAIPSTALPNDMIAPYWTDLNPAAGGAIYYYNYNHLAAGSPADRRNFDCTNTNASSRAAFRVNTTGPCHFDCTHVAWTGTCDVSLQFLGLELTDEGTRAPIDGTELFRALCPSSCGGAQSATSLHDVGGEESRSKFVVEWNSIPYYCTNGPQGQCGTVSFQALLYPSGAIKFQYQNIARNPNPHGRPVIGLENSDGTSGLQMSSPPKGMLYDPAFRSDIAYYVPRPCATTSCAHKEWLVQVFRNNDFTEPVSTSCAEFESGSGFLATSLTCHVNSDTQTSTSLLVSDRMREYDGCWCPASLRTYVADSPSSAGSSDNNNSPDILDAHPMTVVDIVSVGLDNYTTYRLSLSVPTGSNVYAIYGTSSVPITMPPAYQHRLEFQTSALFCDVGGISPVIMSLPGAHTDIFAYDSWLTVGPTDGSASASELTSVGINFDTWTESTNLTAHNGTVFWVDPANGPYADTVVIAQLSIPHSDGQRPSAFRAVVNAKGKRPDMQDWQEENIQFQVGPPPPSPSTGVPGQPSDPCEDFSAIMSTTMNVSDNDSGRYTFFQASHLTATLFLDGQQLVSEGCVWRNGDCGEYMYTADVTQGTHRLTVKLVESSGGAYSHVWWQFSGSGCDYRIGNLTQTDWLAADLLGNGGKLTNSDGTSLTDDDFADVPFPAGFTFPFFGGVKDRVRVSTNGYLTFSGEHFSYGDTQPIPSSDIPNDLIAVFWTDFNPEVAPNCGIYTHYDSSTRTFVIQWGAESFPYPLYDSPVLFGMPLLGAVFQVQLRSDGSVTFLYKSVPAPISGAATVTFAFPSIGIENSDGSKGLRISYGDPHFPQAGHSVNIPVACEDVDCDEHEWLVTVYAGTDFDQLKSNQRNQGCSQLHVNASRHPGSIDAAAPLFSCRDHSVCPWRNDGECDEPTVCMPGTDWQDCGSEEAGCWCPHALSDYANASASQQCSSNGFSVRFEMEIFVATAGTYRFTESSPDEINLFVDGNPLHRSGCSMLSKNGSTAANPLAECTDERTFDVDLTMNVHRIEMTVQHRGNTSSIPPTLEWEFVGTNACQHVDDGTFDWVDVSGLGTQLSGLAHDGSATVPLPGWTSVGSSGQTSSGFPFFGGFKKQVTIFADGFVAFSSSERGRVTHLPQSLPSPQRPNDLIAPYWADFDIRPNDPAARGHGVYTYQSPPGCSNNQCEYFAVEWHNLRYLGAQESCDFELLMYGNGSMTFSYKELPRPPRWELPAVGLENAAGTDGMRILRGGPSDEHPERDQFWNQGLTGIWNKTIRIPDACQTEKCGPLTWVSSVYSDMQFHNVQSITCMSWAASASERSAGFLNIRDYEQNTPLWCPLPKNANGDCPAFSAFFVAHTLFPRSGVYDFHETSTHSSGVLLINGQNVLTSRTGPASYTARVMLAAGRYEVAYGFIHPLQRGVEGADVDLRWDNVGHGTCEWNTTAQTEWEEINAISTRSWGSGDITDDGYVHADLPFNFPFYGGLKRVARISANGFITFSGDHGHRSYAGRGIPFPDLPNDLIAVYWTDLDPSQGGTIHTYTPSDQSYWVVEWDSIPLVGWQRAVATGIPFANLTATFQAKLFPDGRFELKYQHAPRLPSAMTRSSPVVGMENVDGRRGEQISWRQPTFPVGPSRIIVPADCEVNGHGEHAACHDHIWSVSVYHDLHFQSRVSATCKQYRTDGYLQTCGTPSVRLPIMGPSHGCCEWLHGLDRYGNVSARPPPPDAVACAGNSDGFSAIFSTGVTVGVTAHGDYLFTALFDFDATATVIIDDDVAFVWCASFLAQRLADCAERPSHPVH
jgi:hypothetical protein